jgi:type IX secretion system PorP/SprF family membrane protein
MLLSHILFAQDVLYSQFNYNPVNLNPAFAGTGKNNLRISGLSKIQWLNLNSPFRYYSGAIDYSLFDAYQRNILNAGATISSSNRGYLSNTNISGIVGRSFGTNSMFCTDWFLSIALQVGYNFAKVNTDRYVFSDQINQTGLSGNLSEVDLLFNNGLKNYFDFSSGFTLTVRKFMVGGSVHHMNEPNNSFIGSPTEGFLPKKISGHLSYVHDGNQVKLKPTVICQYQGKSRLFLIGTLIDYKDFPIEFGLWLRNSVNTKSNSALSIGLTWKWGNSNTVTSRTKEYSSKFGFGYDADIYSPGLVSTYGGLEFGIQKDIILNDNRYCPTSNSGICYYKFPWEFF